MQLSTFATKSVINRPYGPENQFPIYPRKQTSGVRVGMSELCQTRKWSNLFNHLVGEGE